MRSFLGVANVDLLVRELDYIVDFDDECHGLCVANKAASDEMEESLSSRVAVNEGSEVCVATEGGNFAKGERCIASLRWSVNRAC